MDRDLSNRVCVGVGTDSPAITVRELQATLFPPMSPSVTGPDSTLQLPRLGSGSFLGSFLLKSNQVLVGEDRPGAPVARLREPRELFALGREQPCPSQQAARWPAECQVLDERVEHIPYNPPTPEQYYIAHSREATPKPLGEEFGSLVFQYYPISAINYFNRSCTGGSPYLQNPSTDIEHDDLRFESRFESGNLAKAIKLTSTFYELYVRTDLYTNRHTQWFYFRISNAKRHVMYRFSIVNLSKGESLYTCGMKPLMYSTKDAKLHSIGWRRCGENIAYFCNENGNPEEDQPATYTLSFTLEFPHDGDVVYLAHSYPYTYTDLQEYLMALASHPVKSAYSSLRLLCRTLAGNNVYYVTVTSPSLQGGDQKKKKAIVITARVHPGESPSSWMMKGLLDFLTGDTGPARDLRDKFIFKLVPMLNPDGVIVGNSRCSLTGRDLNRQYRTVIRETYPSIWHTKLMVRRLLEECGVAMYCDFHAHSRQNNVFIYGCENRRGYDRYLNEQVFPLMLHKNAADKFSFENCKFKVQRAKEGTGRVVMWMMGICNSYTMEASFSGSDLGPRVDTHFSAGDYEQMGRAFCQTLLDFYDDAPNKEKLRCKILKRLLKEGSTAEEPTNIDLSDYSSDEGDSSTSDEAGRDRESPSLVVPPPSPNLPQKIFKKKNAPYFKNISKSPTAQRKVLPMYHTTLGLSLAETDSSDSDTGNETSSTRQGRPKTRKILRRKKPKKINKIHGQEHSDTELQVKKHSRKSLSVLELIPAEKLRSQSWNRFAGFPMPKALDIRHVRNTTRQLAEVQAKLITLRQRIWTGLDDGDHHQPLSWGYSSFSTTNIGKQTREVSKKIKDTKKSKSCDDEKKTEKKPKKKSKRQKEDTKKTSQKKKSNGIKRQTAVDWPNYDNRRQTVKSKSLQDDNNGRILERRLSITESCGELDDRKKKTKTKKKKRKGNWEKKAKTLVNVNAFVRKVNAD